ncbi:hypothetical protein [Candidatus Methylocalor cossyra]|uniref:Spermidine synthase n=1 Tax=Candidatus Methylocalor cossyra TaxID=3108543 RepID=A0ABM9NJL2_9GAMM
MRKYGGAVIHRDRDQHGWIEVVDTFGVRSLHFGTPSRQSAMSLVEPERLELPYVRAMLTGLLFRPDPGPVLLLGLGGGSLARFLLRHFPDCRIEAVESRARVVELARRFFQLPEDPRLTVHVADGRDFVCARAEGDTAVYGQILVDAYDQAGLAPQVQGHEFFAAAVKLLQGDGVLAINLWGSDHPALRQGLALLDCYCQRRTLRLPVFGRGNVIGFGFGAALAWPGRELLERRARALERRLGIEFPRLLRACCVPQRR